jgi:hypothetical protein
MNEILGFIFYVIFDVIFFRIGKFVITLTTFGRINVTLNGALQPLTSLVGLLVVIGIVIAIIYFI